MRKPATIVLTLLGAAVMGTACRPARSRSTADADDWGAAAQAGNALDDDNPDAVAAVAENKDYPNDYFVPGAGYYHAPFHAFFPYRYNYFEAGRGYYYGGSWFNTAQVSPINSSRPSMFAMHSARHAFTSMHSSSMGHSSSVSRGGFGSTGHGSHSSSS